jgi:thiamine pyrophosphokinase
MAFLFNMTRTIIFANGELPNIEKARALIKADDYIICADGGTRHALALGLKPNLIVGDLDSVTDVELQKADAKVMQYPRDKNETDLELALNHALERKPTSLLIIAALGNRLDQTLGNISLLSDPRIATLDIRLDDGIEEVFFCRNQSKVRGRSGDIVSLIPWNGAVKGISTNGLRWPLNNETLYPDKTRGLSNEMLDAFAEINIESGLLLITHLRL